MLICIFFFRYGFVVFVNFLIKGKILMLSFPLCFEYNKCYLLKYKIKCIKYNLTIFNFTYIFLLLLTKPTLCTTNLNIII